MPLGVAGPQSKGPIRTYLFLMVCLFAVSLCPDARAQSTTSLGGLVLDPTDALVPGASVVLQNVGTAAVLTTTANGEGRYQFLYVMPGTYRIRATMAGFRDVSVGNFQLLVNTPAWVSLKFVRLDAPEQKIEVRVPPINAVDATIGNTIQHIQIAGLPLEGRNVGDLLSLQPGVLYTAIEDRVIPDTRAGTVNGARSDQTNITQDGVDVNDQETGVAFKPVLPTNPDATRELRFITASATAGFGRSSGGQVAMITQSGDNEFHGLLFANHRNTATAANNFFNNSTVDPVTGQTLPRPKLIRNIFGGSIGGPIKKRSVFFYFNFEDTITRREEPQLRIVPTDTLRQGTLQYLDSLGNVQEITPDALTAMDPLAQGPNPWVLALMQAYPRGNDPTQGDGGLNFIGFRFNAPMEEDKPSYIGRIDYVSPESRHNLFVRGSLADYKETEQAPQFPGQPSARTLLTNSRGFAIGHTWNISPELINSVRWGLTRQGLDYTGAVRGPGLELFGIDSFQNFGARNAARTVPVHNITEDLSWMHGQHIFQFGINFRNIHNKRYTEERTYPFYRTNLGLMENFGFDLLPTDIDPDFGVPYVQAQMAVLGTISQIDSTYFVNRDGDGFFPAPHVPRREFINNEFEWYAQDQWKLSRSVTLTAGLRYSYFAPPYEKNGLQVRPSLDIHTWFENRSDGAAAGIPSNQNPVLSFDRAGKGNNAPPIFDPDRNNFAPRVGVAWTPSFSSGLLHNLFGNPGQSSIRMGAGLFYGRSGGAFPIMMDLNGAYGLTAPGTLAVPNYVTASRFAGMSALGSIPIGTPPDPTFPATPDTSIRTALTRGFLIDTRLRTPYSTTFNISVSRELPGDLSLEAAYIGHIGRKLLVQADISAPLVNFRDPASGQTWVEAMGIVSDLISQETDETPILQAPSIPFVENVFAPLGSAEASASQAFYEHMRNLAPSWTDGLRALDLQDNATIYGPYAFFQQQYDWLPTWSNLGESSYHSFQLILRKRFTRGLQLDFNYTMAKSLDNGSSTESEGQGVGQLLSAFSPRQSLAYSDFDVRHQINSNFMLDVPVGQGQRYASTINPVLNQIVGGWSVTGVVRWRTGFPFGNTTGNGNSYPTNFAVNGPPTLKSNVARPATQVSKGLAGGPNIFENPEEAYDSFEHTKSGFSGSRNALHGPGYFSIDTGVQKSFRVGERQQIQFRWETFNLTNTVNFDGRVYPVGNKGIDFSLDAKSSFGRLKSLAGNPRIMQFTLRYQF